MHKSASPPPHPQSASPSLSPHSRGHRLRLLTHAARTAANRLIVVFSDKKIIRRGTRASLVCTGTFTAAHQQPHFFLSAPSPTLFFLLVLRLTADAHLERFYSPPLACRGQSIAVCLSKLDHVDKTQQSAEPSQRNPFDWLVHSLLDDGLG